MKKLFIILVICMVLLASGAFAETFVSKDFQEFARKIAVNKGIDEENIKGIKRVDFKNLPSGVDIENIDETNLAIYEIDVRDEKPVYVLTVSEEAFKDTVKKYLNKMFLNFGTSNEFKESVFLETATGVQGSLDKGYVMMRDGSITGLSTNLEILESDGVSEVEIIIYKNQEPVGFRNTIIVEDIGVKKDYDVVSINTIIFEAGDVISVYVNVNGTALVDDVITIMEINTE